MKRNLSEEEVEQLSEEDCRFLLGEQFETHRRLREQAQSIIRMVISGVGVIVALIGYKLYPEFELPSRTVTIAGGAVEFNGLVQSMAENSIFVSALFTVTALGLLFSAVMKSIGVLSRNGPVPISRSKSLDREFSGEAGSSVAEKMSDWILTNDVRLVEAEREIEQSYLHIWAAFGTGFIAVFLTGAALLGSVRFMGLIHTGLILLGPIAVVLFLKNAVQTFRSRSNSGETPSDIGDAIDVVNDVLVHQGVDAIMKFVFIFFYSIYFDYSYNIAYFWLTTFVV